MKNLKTATGWLFAAIMALVISQVFTIPFIPLFIALSLISLLPAQKTALNVVVSNPLIGKSSGSMGGATFTTWKGKNVLKNKASSVANPNTINQQMRRSALEQAVAIFRANSAAINLGYKKKAVGMSPYNAFSREVLKNAFDYSTPPTATLEPQDLLFSSGNIETTEITGLTADRSANTVLVDFSPNATGIGQSVNDKVILLAYNTTLQTWSVSETEEIRSTGQAQVSMPGPWAVGNTVRSYLSFYNPISGETSNTRTLTGTIIA
jgi:hypothetical protein